jgi:hypothetical protein
MSYTPPNECLICLPCAKAAHATAGTTLPELYERALFDNCASCGRHTSLLPARLFGVAGPAPAARKFATSISGVLNQLAGWGHKVQAVRARYDAGNYWVEITPCAGMAIRLEASRDKHKAIGRFVQAVGRLQG